MTIKGNSAGTSTRTKLPNDWGPSPSSPAWWKLTDGRGPPSYSTRHFRAHGAIILLSSHTSGLPCPIDSWGHEVTPDPQSPGRTCCQAMGILKLPAFPDSSCDSPARPIPTAHLAALHVLHVHGVLHALALLLLVLLLLAAALLTDTEAAGEEQEAGDHGNGDQRPGRDCPQRREPPHAVVSSASFVAPAPSKHQQ